MAKYGYVILFPLALLEGPVVALLAGFFVRLGYFEFLPALLILILGDIVPDTIFYYIGRFGNGQKLLAKYGHYLKISRDDEEALENVWRNHGKKTMFVGKLAYGLGLPFLASAGFAKLPVRTFWSYAIPISFLQYGVFMTMGFYFGQSYQALIAHYIEYAQIIIAVLVVVLLASCYILKKWLSDYIKKNL